MNKYFSLKRMKKIELSDDDWQIIYDAIHNKPKNREIALIAQNKVLISTLPELKEDTVLSENHLWGILKTSCIDYSYQFETPSLRTKENKILLISRMNKLKSSKNDHFFKIVFIFLTFFITLCIIIIYNISKSIFDSLIFLEKQTLKIVEGDLSVKIEAIPHLKSKNEITSLSDSLEHMRASLQEAKERRSYFIMGISHDLRTPIAVIKGYTEAMADGIMTSKEEIQQALDIINIKINQLESMIDALLHYEKFDSKDWGNKLTMESLFPFLNGFAKNAETTGAIFHRSVKANINMSDKLKIPINIQLARRAFENIYSNALRYTKENDSIYINVSENEKDVVVIIEDTGCGIEEKDIKHIFDLFYRGTNSRREAGMGIGLSVVKNIIDIHGWKIDINSKKNEGTKFIITIPK